MTTILNSFGPRFDPQSIPPYDDWVANNSFNPFGPEPFAPTPYTNPGTLLHSHTRGESPVEGGVDVGSRVDRGHGSSMDMTCSLLQRSRFAFAQKRIERTTNASMSQIPAARVHQSSAGQSRIPAPIKATSATVSRVIRPRPFRSQSAFHARREPALAVPKTVHPLPTRLTDFEDYEEELLAKFCPLSEGFSPSTSTFFTTTGVEHHSDRVLEYPPLSMTPPFGFSNPGYTGTGIEVVDWRPEADEHFDKGNEGYDPFEFDVDSDFGSDCVSFESESFAPYVVGAFDWPTPYQGQIPDGYPHASGATSLGFPPQGSPSLPLSGPHGPSFNQLDPGTTQLPDNIPWSAFANPFAGAPIMTPPPTILSHWSPPSYRG